MGLKGLYRHVNNGENSMGSSDKARWIAFLDEMEYFWEPDSGYDISARIGGRRMLLVFYKDGSFAYIADDDYDN